MEWIANLLGILSVLPFALAFISGHGGGLLAGYNTMTQEQQQQYDEKALLRAAGIMLLLCCASLLLSMGLMLIESIRRFAMDLSWILFTAIIIGGVIYINTGNRYKKKD